MIFLFNAGEIVIDNAVYHLPISLSIPRIFALKVHTHTHGRTHVQSERCSRQRHKKVLHCS